MLAQKLIEEAKRKDEISESESTSNGHRSVNCLRCQTELGYYDPEFLGIKFYKWRLQYTNPLTDSASSSLSSHREAGLPASIFVMSKIISKMSSHLVTKFLLTPTSLSECSRFMLLWIFGASLRFSSSRLDVSSVNRLPPNGQPAIKIFWKLVSEKNASIIREGVGIEEVSLPLNVISEIEDSLKTSSLLLPACSQVYQDWKVGLLERYEK